MNRFLRDVDGDLAVAVTDPRDAAALATLVERWYRAWLHRGGRDVQPSPVLEDLIDALRARAALGAIAASGNEPRLARVVDAHFLSTMVTSRVLGIPPRTVRHRAERGRIPGARRSHRGDWLIPAAYLTARRRSA